MFSASERKFHTASLASIRAVEAEGRLKQPDPEVASWFTQSKRK
jgi:hypothetical protein